MNILFVHQNFPAQFGHIAGYLAKQPGYQCAFVSETPAGNVHGIEKIQYQLAGGARATTHYCSRTFENGVWHSDAVFNAVKENLKFKPDLIVGHSGFGSTVFLPELLPNTPIINLFEYYFLPHDPQSDIDFRTDLNWKISQEKYKRSRCRNAMILLDLHTCDIGYVPTEFQRSRFPSEYQPKLRKIFDGVDRDIYHGHEESLRPAVENRGLRKIAGVDIPADTRVVTYVSRGFESMRGFDLFMRAAKRIHQEYPNVIFLIIGADRIAYGGDLEHIPGFTSFKDWTLAQEQYDLSPFRFLGNIPPRELALALAAADLHIYLTVPFVLSWSMMDAMSCGAVVLASATAPVQEMITDGENGLLADFFDVEQLAQKAVKVLKDPAAYRPLGRAAEKFIAEKYAMDVTMPQMLKMYQDAANDRNAKPKMPEPEFPPLPEKAAEQATSAAAPKSPFLG